MNAKALHKLCWLLHLAQNNNNNNNETLPRAEGLTVEDRGRTLHADPSKSTLVRVVRPNKRQRSSSIHLAKQRVDIIEFVSGVLFPTIIV